MRKVARVPPDLVPDSEVGAFFQIIDRNNDNQLDPVEFALFLRLHPGQAITTAAPPLTAQPNTGLPPKDTATEEKQQHHDHPAESRGKYPKVHFDAVGTSKSLFEKEQQATVLNESADTQSLIENRLRTMLTGTQSKPIPQPDPEASEQVVECVAVVSVRCFVGSFQLHNSI